LRDFFFKVLNVLEKGELASREAMQSVDRKKEALAAAVSSAKKKAELQQLLEAMSPRYLLYTAEPDIAAHVELYRQLRDAPFVWRIQPSQDGRFRTVTLCAPDRPGLIASIAGVFTLNYINILDVQVFTWRNRVALDIFRVQPPPDLELEAEKWQKAARQLAAALEGELDLAATLEKKIRPTAGGKVRGALRPHRVRVDNTASSFFTIVEIITYDFPGLLYTVTDALFRCGLSIWVAKIATKADQVVDVFYVRDFGGQKVDSPEQEAAIREEILKRLAPQAPDARRGRRSVLSK